MAAAGRMQLVKKETVAAICIVFVLMAAPLWGMAQVAQASSISYQAAGVLIRWDEGQMARQSLVPGVGSDARLEALLDENPRIERLLDGFPGALSNLKDGQWPTPQIEAVALPEGMPLSQALELYASLPGVRYVEPDVMVSADACPQDPYYSRQWFLPRIGAEEAWDTESGNQNLVVAVLDSGVEASHPDLAGRVLKGYDFVDRDGDTSDVWGHGTHVAGIIAACGDNGVGVAGLAWRVKILPVKVLDDNGSGSYSNIIAGIYYAADNGAAVINLSLGSGARSQALQEAVDYARAAGASVVAAGGNDALNSLSYPAACEGVLGVGATNEDNARASFSNRGGELDLVAPGTSIYSDIPGGGCAYMSGTSMSAPQVSGALALLLSNDPALGSVGAENRILSSALDLGPSGRDPDYGWGLLQVDRALGLKEPGSNDGEAGGGRWYFAEGYTGAGFDTYILLENPGTQGSEARLDLFGSQGPSASKNVEVGPRARLTIRINDLVPPGDVAASINLPEGSRIMAQRSMYFNYRGIGGGHTSRGSPASSEWYFAEGYTGPGYDTYLVVFNPQRESARVDVSLMTPNGVVDVPLDLPPLTRRTLKLNDVLPGAEMAIAIAADRPVVAERAMYFNVGGRDGGSDAAGVTAPAREWYFAEGYTGGDFDQWLLLANPSDVAVAAKVTFMRGDGMTVARDLELRPRSRETLHVDEVTGLENAEVSAEVRADSPGVVAERAMYFIYYGSMGAVGGGHAAGGATAPSSHWLVPEGYTGVGFESWLQICNLEDEAVSVGLDLYGEGGARVHRDYLVQAHSRFSVKENDLLPGQGLSAEINAPEGVRLVVEGAFYFRYRGNIDDGST